MKGKGREQDWAGMVDRQQCRSDRDSESPTERSTLRITYSKSLTLGRSLSPEAHLAWSLGEANPRKACPELKS